MKPNLPFLRKVQAGSVMWRRSWRRNRGDYLEFIGGQKTAEAHATAGLIVMPYSPHAYLGKPALATLTDAGRKVLDDATV